MTALEPVLAVLSDVTGLTADSLGLLSVNEAVHNRMKRLGSISPQEYAVRLRGNSSDLQDLLNDITVNESWFFRGGALFEYLAGRIRDEVAQGGRPYRVLSIPCSAGEEPYSLAMALDAAGVSPSRVSIRGLDLSRKVVESGQIGLYRGLAMREVPPIYAARYFSERDGFFEVSPEIRSRVELEVGNLLHPMLMRTEEKFDLILCRNLLIYLDAAARRLAQSQLLRMLSPDGMIALGHADPISVLDDTFRRVGPSGGFLFERMPKSDVGRLADSLSRPADRGGLAGTPPAAGVLPASNASKASTATFGGLKRPSSRPVRIPPSPRTVSPAADGLPASQKVPDPSPAQTPPPTADIQTVRGLADRGDLAAALAGCHSILAASSTAEVYSLLGTIQHALGDDTAAAEAFRRAIYLDPNHADSLMHLMLLKRQSGRHVEADRLQLRYERTRSGGVR